MENLSTVSQVQGVVNKTCKMKEAVHVILQIHQENLNSSDYWLITGMITCGKKKMMLLLVLGLSFSYILIFSYSNQVAPMPPLVSIYPFFFLLSCFLFFHLLKKKMIGKKPSIGLQFITVWYLMLQWVD